MSDTKSVRKGEELGEDNLQDFIKQNFSIDAGEISIEQFPAGASNLTYCVKIGVKEYVLRRPPFGNQVKSAHDMSREFNVLSKLSAVYKPAPKPLIYCDNESVIGSPFYLMERRHGLIIRGKSPTAEARALARAQSETSAEAHASARAQSETPAEARASARAQNETSAETRALARAQNETLENSTNLRKNVSKSFIKNLVNLHSLDYKAIGLGDLGKPEGYARRQVEGWTKRYFNAKTDEWKALESAIEWLNSNIPDSETAALVHNDYKFDNIMLNPEDLTEIVAVLDWEMATIGDPLMDLGTTLGYWMSKDVGEEMMSMPFNPRILMENISRRELVDIYAEKSGRDASNILFYYVFGTFKIAVIAQQIYFRYSKGFTQDKRFATFNFFVKTLGEISAGAIKSGEI